MFECVFECSPHGNSGGVPAILFLKAPTYTLFTVIEIRSDNITLRYQPYDIYFFSNIFSNENISKINMVSQTFIFQTIIAGLVVRDYFIDTCIYRLFMENWS